MIATVTLNPSLDEWMELLSLQVGKLNRASGFVRYPGGKGINVSRVIHELGGRTLAFGLAGGEDGLILRELLNRLCLPHEFVNVEGLTRNNYKIRTRRPRALTEINMVGPAASPAALRSLQRRVLAHRPRPRCVVLSGSLPPGAAASTYRDWIIALRKHGIPCILDASGAPLRYGLAARPWMTKPNRQEAEELLGRSLASLRAKVAAVQALARRGPAVVVLSLGAEGALMASASWPVVWLGRPPKVKTLSAVGAGDSLVGGFVSGWANGASLIEAFRRGLASGTAAAMTPGTELCHRRDVRHLLRRVVIRRVA